MKIPRLVVAYPGGNTTALICGDLPNFSRQVLNLAIINEWQWQNPNLPQIEQCCFVTESSKKDIIGAVEMLGGEFCGNATRCAAWLLTGGKNGSGFIRSSGSSQPLGFNIQSDKVELAMPEPADVKNVNEGMLIKFSGITQLVIDDHYPEIDLRKLLKRLLKSNIYGLADRPAVGISRLSSGSRVARFVVWVKALDTIFDETACGSGSCSIALAKALDNSQSVSMDIGQPSGSTIKVKVNLGDNGELITTTIAGAVKIIYDGEFSIAQAITCYQNE